MDDKTFKPRPRARPATARTPASGAAKANLRPRAGRDETAAPAETGERIAKRLARAGIASRREAEGLIADGRIRVNGAVLTSPAVNVGPDDRIELDGQLIPAPERTRLFLFHKPAGVVTTSRDPEGRRTVFDVLPQELPRLITIGRLDINTEGLLLLTNDGGLARVLELPATGWLRRYRVRVHGEVDEERLKGLAGGIAVDGVFYGAIEAALERKQGTNAWLSIGLREGKNREVKNVLGALGLEVNRLIRVSFGPFQLGDLPEGHVQEIKGRMLRDQLGERLIAEAGANFEAEIEKPFSNKPVRREAAAPAVVPDRKPRERVSREEIDRAGEGGLIRKPRRERGDRRGDALSRLQTSRPERREEPKRSGTSNVWMAPGARPEGKPKAEMGAKPLGVSGGRVREAPGRQESGRKLRTEGPQRTPRGAPGDRAERQHAGLRPARAEGQSTRERPEPGDRRQPFSRERGSEDRPAARPSFRPRGEDARPPRAEKAERPFRPRGERPEGERGAAEGRPARPRFGKPGTEGSATRRPGEGDRPAGSRPFKPKGPPKGPSADRPFAKKPPRGAGAPGSSGDRPRPRGAGPKGGRGPAR